MEIIIGILVVIIGLLYNKEQKSKVAVKLAETKARDQVLKEQEQETKAQIATLDAGIKKMKEQRELEAKRQAEKNLTLKERADRLKNGLK